MGKYLVTGITGFLAPHLAEILYKNGHEVYGFSRRASGMESDILDAVSPECYNAIKFLYGDFCNYQSIEKVFQEHKFDGVFHCGAQSNPPVSLKYPILTWETNVMGSLNIFECIEKYSPSTKICFVSTSEVYGNGGSDGHAIKETDMLSPSNPYGSSKAAIDLYLQERFANKKLNGFITRAFSHTGVRRGRNFSISSDAYQIARIVLGLQDPVVEVGNLETVRVVIDGRDVAEAYYKLMMSAESNGQVFNIAGYMPRQMGYFTDKLIDFAEEMKPGLKIKKQVSDKYYRPIDIACQIADTKKVETLIGWAPVIDINDTLKDLLNYWIKKLS